MVFENDNILYSTIGKNIKKYRLAAKITQAKLCEMTGISLSYLTKLESEKCEKSISLSLLNLLANTMNVEITEFFKECD